MLNSHHLPKHAAAEQSMPSETAFEALNWFLFLNRKNERVRRDH